MRPYWLVAVCLFISTDSLFAQVRKPPAARTSDLCVDVASLRQGKSVRGLVVAGEGTGGSPWLMAVERELTRQDNPTLFAQAAKLELQKAVQAYTELKSRIEQELSQPEVDGSYQDFLQRELDRITPLLANMHAHSAVQTRFMWLELTNKECTGIRRAPADAQRVAVWAWNENLVDVTKRSRADLERELADARIDAKRQVPDLSSELPPRPEPEEKWLTRAALARYTMLGAIDFQGASGVYARTGHGQALGAAEIGPLIQKMMGGSLDELIKELDPAAKANAKATNSAQWFSSVTSQVDGLKRREFRITRLDQDPSGQAATVETALVAKLPQRGWQIVWSSQQTRQAADVTAQAEEKLSQDPQIQAALGLLSALGAGAEAEVKKAIRFGAATMAAQQACESDLVRFRDRYLNRLDGPPL